MKKILLFCNNSNTVMNFRKELILFLKEKGFDIFIIAGDDYRENDIKELGASFKCIQFSNRSKSIKNSLKVIKEIKVAISNIEPDIVFSFQIKPNIFGGIATRKLKFKNFFAMIEGLGDPFQPKGLFGKLFEIFVSKIYKYSLKEAKKVFVLNHDDENLLLKKHIVTRDQCLVINGIGIDTSLYKPSFIIPRKNKIVNLSRLVKTKGIFEYCKVARLVRKQRPDIEFELYGAEEQLSKNVLSSYIEDGSIIYKGYTKNAVEVISESKIVLSTSYYREGLPRMLMEAMAVGKPIIASDTVGNRDMIVDSVNGYLVESRNIELFAKKIIEIIDDSDLLLKLGKNGRRICEQKYDSKLINSQIFEIVNE